MVLVRATAQRSLQDRSSAGGADQQSLPQFSPSTDLARSPMWRALLAIPEVPTAPFSFREALTAGGQGLRGNLETGSPTLAQQSPFKSSVPQARAPSAT